MAESRVKTAGKEYSLGVMAEKHLRRRIRVLRQVVGWTRLLGRLDGSADLMQTLAPFFKRYFAVDGIALWLREQNRWELVMAAPPILEAETPRHIAWRNGRPVSPREQFATPPRFASRIDLLIAMHGEAPLGWLTLMRAGNAPFSLRERNLLHKLMELFAAHLTVQARVRDAQAQAMTDPLTAIWNRRYFEDRYLNELQRARRYHRSLAVVMLDIDSFKDFNDTWGHLAGDQALQAVSQLLKNNLRQSDILCRYGGDEFVVLLPESDQQHALLAADKLRRAVAAEPVPAGKSGGTVYLTISFGVAAYPENGDNEMDLLHQADRALYAAKRSGRNLVRGAQG